MRKIQIKTVEQAHNHLKAVIGIYGRYLTYTEFLWIVESDWKKVFPKVDQ